MAKSGHKMQIECNLKIRVVVCLLPVHAFKLILKRFGVHLNRLRYQIKSNTSDCVVKQDNGADERQCPLSNIVILK